MRQLHHLRFQQSAFDFPQHRLDRSPGHLPRRFERRVAFRIVAQIVGELRPRTPMTQAAGLIHDHRIRGGTILETLHVCKIRLGHAIPHPPLQCQRDALPHREIRRLAFRRSLEPRRIGQYQGWVCHKQTDCTFALQEICSTRYCIPLRSHAFHESTHGVTMKHAGPQISRRTICSP